MRIREGPGGDGIGTMPLENAQSTSHMAAEGTGNFSAEGWHKSQSEGTLISPTTRPIIDG